VRVCVFALLFVKIKKPLIERRRRERINDSLNQLKNLVLEATNKDVSPLSIAFMLSQCSGIAHSSHSNKRLYPELTFLHERSFAAKSGGDSYHRFLIRQL